MKILLVIYAMVGGGAERVMATLANYYAEQKNEVVLLTDTSVKSVYSLHPNIRLLNLKEGCPVEEKNIFDKLTRYVRRIYNIRSIAIEESPDVVISFNVDLNYDVIFSLLGTHIPLICSEHTNISRRFGYKTQFLRRLLYPFADAITVLTRHDYHIWQRHNNVVYMPNPIKLNENQPLSKAKQKVVLASGRISAWYTKGFDNLVKCWGHLCSEFPDWELHIAGAYDSEPLAYLEQLSIQHNANNIKFLGFRNDLNKLMAQSAIFCLSSRLEGLPMVLLEAMNEACCCVAFDCNTGPREIIHNGANGILVDNQNNDALIDALRIVMGNSELRTRLSENTKDAIAGYSIERITNRWDILINKVISNG